MKNRQSFSQLTLWTRAQFARDAHKLKRFGIWFEYLASLPRATRRWLGRKWAMPLTAAALLLALTSAPLHAANLTVAAGAAGINSGDGCSLVEAIFNSNNDMPTYAECLAGNGADTIILPANATLNYSAEYLPTSSVCTALPAIASPITIQGNGATIQRASGASVPFRLVGVASFGNLTLNNATLANGLSVVGGALFNNGTTTLNHSTVSGNTATNGGGIANLGTLTLNHSVVNGNTGQEMSLGGSCGSLFAFPSGGGILNLGTLVLNNSTVSGNTNTGSGGGILNAQYYSYYGPIGGLLTLNNSTLTGNSTSVGVGGGIAFYSGTMDLNKSIISGNSAPSQGEIFRYANEGTIYVNNHNVFGHSGETNGDAFSGFFMPGATDINATSDGNGSSIDIPTALANILNPILANNGGPTKTHALVADSPAFDRAPNADCAASPINGIDQRGAARNFDGNGSASANECDSGAVEFRNPTTNCALATAADIAIENVTFNFSALGALSCLTVDEMGTNHLLAPSSIQTANWWFITGNGSGFTTSIKLPLTSADASDKVCRNTGASSWDCAGAGAANFVTRTGVTAFSDWAAQNNAPTAATLTKFGAKVKTGKTGKQVVRVKWETGSEVDVVGFRVWGKGVWNTKAAKDAKPAKGWVQLSAELIAAEHAGEIIGDAYKFTDKKVKAGKTYSYKLEIVMADGTSDWSEIVKVKVQE